MPNLERPRTPNPYDLLPTVPTFTVTSEEFLDGQPVTQAQVAVGTAVSPQLSWAGAPEATRSYAVTCFDPDAPSPSGIWHWLVVNIPATTTSLNRGIAGGPLPTGAFEVVNDSGNYGFIGAAPPPGDPFHRYYFAVHSLDVETLDPVTAHSTPGVTSFYISIHTLARAVMHGTYEG